LDDTGAQSRTQLTVSDSDYECASVLRHPFSVHASGGALPRNWETRHDEGRQIALNTYGVIFDGDPGDKSDVEWTRHAVTRYRQVMSSPQTVADEVIFQSWQNRPTHMLPEYQPGTLTSAVIQAMSSMDRIRSIQ
jgi:hypothetical protein